jgi:hypothetical protein
MRRILTLCAFVSVFTGLALAESWTGRLVDANCMDQQQKGASASACDPTGATTAFAIVVSGKPYKFDDAGNTKAAEALKSRADRSADPNKAPSPQVAAKVSGAKDGDSTLKVENIEVQ